VRGGDFLCGGGLMNQLEKMSLKTNYLKKSNSGFDENQQSAVAVPDHNVVFEHPLSRTSIINTNESTHILAGYQHRLTNLRDNVCVMIEVQSGSGLGEDDIVRYGLQR
jgi:hypothetical protein